MLSPILYYLCLFVVFHLLLTLILLVVCSLIKVVQLPKMHASLTRGSLVKVYSFQKYASAQHEEPMLRECSY